MVIPLDQKKILNRRDIFITFHFIYTRTVSIHVIIFVLGWAQHIHTNTSSKVRSKVLKVFELALFVAPPINILAHVGPHIQPCRDETLTTRR